LLGDIDHLFEGNIRCFMIKFKGRNLNFIKKEIRKGCVQFDIVIYSCRYSARLFTTRVIRVLVVFKQMLGNLYFYFIILWEYKYVYFG